MEILIVKLGALGDVLRTTSILRPLRARYPGARFEWITAKPAVPLLEGNPLVGRVVAIEDAVFGDFSARFDLVLSLEEDAAAAALAQSACRGELVGIIVKDGKLGYTASSAGYYDLSLLNADKDGGHKKADELKVRNRLSYAQLWLKALGLPDSAGDDLRPILALTDADRQTALALSQKYRFSAGEPIGLNPGAGKRWPAKQLSEMKAARLLGGLAAFKRPLLLLGGADEGARNSAIAAQAGNAAVIDVGTGHGLREFAGIIELCGLVISTDSLAFHVATALGVKALALVGPTSAAELDAFGRGGALTPKGGCACFYRPRCQFEASCLEGMPDEAVISAARNLLS